MTGNGSSQEDRAQHSLDGHRYAATRCGEQQSGPVLDEADLNLVGAAVVDTEEPVDRQERIRVTAQGGLPVFTKNLALNSVRTLGSRPGRAPVASPGTRSAEPNPPIEPAS